jgi:hypothetical protein
LVAILLSAFPLFIGAFAPNMRAFAGNMDAFVSNMTGVRLFMPSFASYMPAIGLSVRDATPRRLGLSRARRVTGTPGGPIAQHMDGGERRERSTTSLRRRIRLHILEIRHHPVADGRRTVEHRERERRLPFLHAGCLFPIRGPSLLGSTGNGG